MATCCSESWKSMDHPPPFVAPLLDRRASVVAPWPQVSLRNIRWPPLLQIRRRSQRAEFGGDTTMSQPTEIPAYTLPPGNRRVLLVRRPHGVPQAADFSLDEQPIPPIGDGQFLVRNIYLSVDPAQRGWASAEANYSQPVPLGGPMRGLAVGVVVRSNDADVAEGEFLYGWFDWQDYAAADRSRIVMRARAAVPLSALCGAAGDQRVDRGDRVDGVGAAGGGRHAAGVDGGRVRSAASSARLARSMAAARSA